MTLQIEEILAGNTIIFEILIVTGIIGIGLLIQYKFLKKDLSKIMISSLSEIMDHRVSTNNICKEENIIEVKQKGNQKKDEHLKVKLSQKHFHKEVLNIYSKFLEEPHRFILTNYYLIVPDSEAKIWASNNVENRRFEEDRNEVEYLSPLISDLSIDLKPFDAKEINKNLTIYDKILLDKIVRKVKEYQDNSVRELFE